MREWKKLKQFFPGETKCINMLAMRPVFLIPAMMQTPCGFHKCSESSFALLNAATTNSVQHQTWTDAAHGLALAKQAVHSAARSSMKKLPNVAMKKIRNAVLDVSWCSSRHQMEEFCEQDNIQEKQKGFDTGSLFSVSIGESAAACQLRSK